MIVLPHLDLESYLPDVGELYSIDTTIVAASDARARRRALVVAVPAGGRRRIAVALRSDAPGRPRTAPTGPPGGFAYLRTIEADLWAPATVTYLDRVDVTVLAEVLGWFGL